MFKHPLVVGSFIASDAHCNLSEPRAVVARAIKTARRMILFQRELDQYPLLQSQ
jgi:hypothetical protein